MSPSYVEYLSMPSFTPYVVYTLAALSAASLLYSTNKLLYELGGIKTILKYIFKKKTYKFIYEFIIHRRFFMEEILGGFAHYLLIIGLGISLIATTIVAVTHYADIVYSGPVFLAFRFLLDVAAVFLILGPILAIYRIVKYKNRYNNLREYIIILIGFIIISLTGMILQRYRIEYYFGGPTPWSPLSYLIPMPSHSLYVYSYFIHIIIAFLLISIIPLTMLKHMIISLVNYVELDRGYGELTTPFDLEKVIETGQTEVKVGVKTKADMEPLHRIMVDACTRCNRCEDVCPATRAGRPLSPRVLINKISGADIDKSFFELGLQEDEVWACTTCGACMLSCPVYIRHIDYIIDIRRGLVFESKLDQKKSDLLMSLSQYGNTQMQSNYGRHDWLRELGVKTVGENPNFEYLLWVGCMGSFDNRARQIIKAFIGILKEAGLLDKIAVLGDEETCCGDPARRLGEESRFQEIVLNNKNIFNKYNVKNIITICPHGYNTFKNEYKRFGVQLNVYHHTEFLNKLLEEGRIKINGGAGIYTIHDPCYLARHNKVVEPQRRIVVKLGELREAELHGERTFCCGAGGANYWYDVKEERRISHIRLEQLMETGASTIVTLCPFCNAMLSDAARNKEAKVSIKDLAEVLYENIASSPK
ncbi:iron-sulfur binding reductase, putative [Thermoproteus uzoniensis 768-20]|uniref:Iron-sulfur binding reductase, putative n=1 Tax=Thermoproteus uzoniensis (strain 768-20) TaxID=999630 RepID=F2L4U6_THEU7|nr:(Fe-S)-binding protein [Thermoproteus uzoniensis]AEA13450.1 iron-sulfur binding reductase, putative [Thermoproteus uzoniensis 768-20]